MVKMFLGEYQPNITEGSRVALPKKLRDQISGDAVILSRGFEKCVFIYDKEDWINESQKQVENPITDRHTRNLRRYMYGNSTEALIDSQGRVVLPPNLREYAGLKSKTAIIGAGNHIEVWDFENWSEYLEKIQGELTA
jgi:MraZ protein